MEGPWKVMEGHGDYLEAAQVLPRRIGGEDIGDDPAHVDGMAGLAEELHEVVALDKEAPELGEQSQDAHAVGLGFSQLLLDETAAQPLALWKEEWK